MKMHKDMQKAMQLWIEALGGPASAQARHNLVFVEATDRNGKEQLCYDNYDATTQTGTLNLLVEYDTLHLHERHTPGGASSATVG